MRFEGLNFGVDGYGTGHPMLGDDCTAADCDDTATLCTTDCADSDVDGVYDCKDPCLDPDGDGYGVDGGGGTCLPRCFAKKMP